MRTLEECREAARPIEGKRLSGWKLHHVMVDTMADGRAYLEFTREKIEHATQSDRPAYVKTMAVFADAQSLFAFLSHPDVIERLTDRV